MYIWIRSSYYSLLKYYIHKINSIYNYYFSWEYLINVLWNKSSLIFTIFSAFLDHLGAQNALQTFSSLTDQLKISYLQHWVYLNTICFRYYSTVIILRGKVIARWVIMSNIYRKITFLLRFITCCMYWYFLMGNLTYWNQCFYFVYIYCCQQFCF